MSTVKSLLAVGLGVSLALSALAGSPTYVTKNASGSTSAEVIFAADPVLQARVVNAIATSDKESSVFSFSSGATPYLITATNAANSTNIIVVRTNGLAPDDVLVLQKADGTTASAIIYSFPASTNIALVATFGQVTLPGDEVYKMSAAVTLPCGATTKPYMGEAIYVGNRGRPVRLVVDGTSAVSIDSASVRYE